MTMANLIRSLVVVCTAIQLCSGTYFWSKPRCGGTAVSSSTTTSASVRSSSTSNFCTLDKAKQIEYLKSQLSKPVSCDDEDSAELNVDSREELNARDHQSMFKLKAHIKGRVLNKIYERNLKKNVVNAKTNRLLRSGGFKANVRNKFIATRSLRGALKTNYRQTSSVISTSNIVGVAGMFLNLPQGYVAKTTTTTVTNLIPETRAYRLGLISTTSVNSGTGTYLTGDGDGSSDGNVDISSANALRSTVNGGYGSTTNVKDGLTIHNTNVRSAQSNGNLYTSSPIVKDGLSQQQQRKLDIINRRAVRGSTTPGSTYVNDKKQVDIRIRNGQLKKPVHDPVGGSNSNGEDNCDDGSKEECDDGPSEKDGSEEKCNEQPEETSKECDGEDSEDGGKLQKAALNVRSTSTRSIYSAKPNVVSAKINQNVKHTRTKTTGLGGKSGECDDDDDDDGEDEIVNDGENYGVRHGRVDINSRSTNTQLNIKKNVSVKGKVSGGYGGKYESVHEKTMSSTRGLDDYSGKGDNLEPRDDDNSGDRSGSRSWEDDDDDDDDGECGEDSGEDASSVYEYASTYKKYNFDVGLNQVSIIGEVLTKLDQQRYMLFDDLAYHQDCTRHVRNKQHFHFIIVGAGKAGCVLANRLSENPKWNVLLIEAGGHPLPATQIPSLWPRVLNTETDWQYEINPSTATGYGIAGAMKIHKGMGLGGASMTSAPVWAIGSEQLYNELVKRGLAEWSYEKCVEYYRKIENVRFDTDKYGRGGLLPISKFHCTEWSMLQKMISAGFVHVGCPVQNDINEPAVEAGFVSLNGVLRNGRTYNTAKAYLTPTLGRKNLQVMQHARVTKIVMDSLNLRAVGVEVRTKYGQILRVNADYEVLVAAGTIGSAQLLMVSGVGPEEHLRKMHVPVVKDLPVGKNFRHTPVFAGIVMSFDKPLMPVQSPEEIAFKYLSRYSGPLSNLNGLQMAAYLKTDVHLSYADVVVHLNYVPAKSMLRLCGLRAAYGFSDRVMNAYAALNAEKDISIITVTLVSPQSSGRIILKGCDPLEKPTVIGNTLGDQRDMDSLMNAIKIITKLTESEAMQLAGSKLEKLELEGCAVYEFNSDDYWKCAVKYLVSSTSSTSGSCSMGLETDCTAVVDSNLKVIGMSNLRVVGQSVLPLSINGYSQAASVMIAERASDIIKTTYTS